MEDDGRTGWRQHLVSPVIASAQFLVAVIAASVVVAVLAPWINGVPAATPIAGVAFVGSLGASLVWLYLRLREEDRRRREVARNYRSPGYPPET